MASITESKVVSEPQPADAWETVRRKGRRQPAKMSAEMEQPTVVPADPTMSLEQVKQNHHRFSSEWTSSPEHTKLQELLSRHTSGRMTKAICFGLGTFDPPEGQWNWKRVAHIQLAAFLTVVEHLQSKKNSLIRCIFQEPRFNSVDKAFITSLGHEVVESPIGFELVDSETMTFGMHLYRPICLQIVAKFIPAMYIGTSYEAWESTTDVEKMDLTRLKEMSQQSVNADFPYNMTDHVFSGSTIYWRKTNQS